MEAEPSRLSRLTLFKSILECITTSCCPEEDILHSLAEFACKVLSCPVCVFVEVDQTNERLKLRYGKGVSASYIKEFHKAAGNKTIRKILWECSDALIFNDVKDNDQEFCDLHLERPFTHALCGPIKSTAKTVGYCQCERHEGDPSFNDDDKVLFEIMSLVAGLALEFSRINKQCKELTSVDQLTNLLRFDIFQNRLTREFSYASRTETPFSLVLMDIDGFNKYTEKNGHSLGNTLLQDIALVLKTNLRNIDLIGRYGADEFILFLTNNDQENAQKTLKRIMAIMADDPAITSTVTFSCGVLSAEAPHKLKTPIPKIINLLGTVLYEAKLRGGNCCSFKIV